MSRTVSRRVLTSETLVRARIIARGIRDAKKNRQWCMVFFSTFYSPVSILALVLHTYTKTTADAK